MATAGGIKLEEGKVYTFIRREKGKQGEKAMVQKERWRMIKAYPHHVQFENQFGIRRSFQYHDIGKLLHGEVIE